MALAKNLASEDGYSAGNPSGLVVREISRDSPEREQWIRTVSEGFAGAVYSGPEFVEPAEVIARIPETRCFLALRDGEPAGGGALVKYGRVAIFFGGSSRPAFRQLGVQRALIQARTEVAHQAGCKWGASITDLGSSSGRNYLRAGFEIAYHKLYLEQD
jgi:GNAT superfamily N-acetyltransferase